MPGSNVPFPPMEAELVAELPVGDEWQYEPKWDGFRGVLENDGGELALWSRKERPLLRYFPELAPLGDLLPPHSALDGEIVIARKGVLDFDAMQTRLHPAESRVRKLSQEIPALVVHARREGGAQVARPLRDRRARRRRREAARAPIRARLAGGRRQGERAQDGRLRAGWPPVEGAAFDDRHPPARALQRQGNARLRRLSRGWGATPCRDRRARATAARGRSRATLLRAEPLGNRRPRGVSRAARARRRGSLRQGSGQPAPARDALHPLPGGQGAQGLHLARVAPAPPQRRPDGGVADL